MSAQGYDRKPQLATLRGMNITLPGDRLTLEWCQLLRNLRSYLIGEWRQRPGLRTEFDTGSADPILWIKRLNNELAGTHKLFAGTQAGDIYDEIGALVDSGYGSEGYSSAVARPDASPQPYLFVGNADRQSKIDVNGARTNWGLPAPIAEPQLELELPAYGTVDDCTSTAGFSASGGSLTAPNRVTATIDYILYDSIVGRWACCAPSSMDENWQEGMKVDMATNPETIIVERVFPKIVDTTVESVAYDTGINGYCAVQPTVPTLGLQRDMLLLLNGEAVRVLSVTDGPNGIPSFRCSTIGTLTAGDTIVGLRSFRAVFATSHSAGESMSVNYVQLAVSGSGIATVGKTATYDLSRTTATYRRPMQPDDFIHLSVRVGDWSVITEIQLQFDCDATPGFTHNYFFKSIRPPDLQAAISQTSSALTAQQQQIQRQQIDDYATQQPDDQQTGLALTGQYDYNRSPLTQDYYSTLPDDGVGFLTPTGQGPLSSPGVSGASQWTELKIPIKEFERVGSDNTRGWQNVGAFQVTVNATAAVDVGIAAIWFGGTFGPDFRIGSLSGPKTQSPTGGLNYIYRMRNTSTGSTSAFSPPARSPVYPHREGVLVRGEALYDDLQADVIDYFRIGGTLGDWYYVGTAPLNDPTFLDTIDDSAAIRNDIADFNRFQPWPVTDLPQSGICDVVGTTVLITSGTLNLNYARNNLIIIDGTAYSFYAKPDTTTQVQLNESAGTLTGVAWQIANPTIEGEPLPVVFGPYGGGTGGDFLFGLGDTHNPGYLYYTLGNDPEAASDAGYIEISTPNEPLIGGTILDGIMYVWSSARSWRILPSFSGGQSGAGGLFYAQVTAMGKGLAGSWALAVGDQLYWVAWDGVWASKGDAIQSLTADSLAPLFKRDGTYIEGGPFQGLYPISFDPADLRWLSLTYSKDGLYLTYRGIDGGYYNLVMSFATQGWSVDSYVQDVHRFYRAEGEGVDELFAGAANGIIYLFDAAVSLDDGEPIGCAFIGRAEDWGDTRAQKLVGDNMIDCAPGDNTLTASLQTDNATGSVALEPPTFTGTERQQFIFDLNEGGGWLARNVALSLTWDTIADSLTRLYEWQPAALLKPEYTQLRATDWDNAGVMGNKWLQGVRITCDTYTQTKTFRVETDGAFTLAELSVVTQGEQTAAFSFPPGTTHQMRIVGNDDLPWRIMEIEWIWEPEPELAQYWHTQFTALDQQGYMHIRDMLVAIRSTSEVVMFISWDEETEDSYTLPSTGGERQKIYVPVLAKKGKVAHFRFFGAEPYSLYLPDTECRVKSWGLGTPYQPLKPFGDMAHTNGGARI